jgi:hypothetical protein
LSNYAPKKCKTSVILLGRRFSQIHAENYLIDRIEKTEGSVPAKGQVTLDFGFRILNTIL